MDTPDRNSPNAKSYAQALADAACGVPGALDPLIHELTPMMWRIARTQGLDEESAQDVTQTIWMRLLANLATIENPAALPGWLATTVRRESWRVRARQRREQPVETEWDQVVPPEPGADSDIVDRLGGDTRARALWRAVEGLHPRCRELVHIIARVDRPSYETIAEALGIPRNSVGPNRLRCLDQLRKALDADPHWRE